MTWRDLAETLKPYVPAVPGTAWLMWQGDHLGMLMWLGVYLLALATVPSALAVGRLVTRVVDRIAV